MKLLNSHDQTPVNPNTGMDPNTSSPQQIDPAATHQSIEGISSDNTSSPFDHIQMGSDGEAAVRNEQQLIQKLLQEKQAGEKKVSKIDALQTGTKRSLSESEVANMRYKFFSLSLLVLAVVLWSSFVHPWLNQYMDKRTALTNAQQETVQALEKIQNARNLNEFASIVESKKGDLTTCINTEDDCVGIVESLLTYVNDTDAARKQAQYYLQIGDLSDPKLLIDERSILTNIDLFLLRYGPNNKPQNRNIGDIASIVISDPVVLQDKMYSVDIELVINFPSDNSLINFLNNAENRIIVNDQIDLPPILYKVQEVGYDIAKHTEAQDTTIKLTAYYYKDTTPAANESTNSEDLE